jgi:beta-glucanase (GH16 family)
MRRGGLAVIGNTPRVRLVRGVLPLLVALAGLGACHNLLAQIAGSTGVDRSKLALTFDEEFDRPPSFWNATTHPDGRWKTNFYFGIQNVDDPRGWESRTLVPNGEDEYYADPTSRSDPFVWQKGMLTIVARPNPDPGDPRSHGLAYRSGLITTEKSFNQRYGYFEARIALPVGKGLWPAFWLLPQPQMVDGWAHPVGQQEIDIFECIGEPGTLYFTNFSDDGGRKVADSEGRQFFTNADLTQFHTYGLALTPTNIVWYFDDQEVRRRPNKDFHMPAYMLINLAVGGDWPGRPDATTRFPAEMRIQWVRAYQLKTPMDGPTRDKP